MCSKGMINYVICLQEEHKHESLQEEEDESSDMFFFEESPHEQLAE